MWFVRWLCKVFFSFFFLGKNEPNFGQSLSFTHSFLLAGHHHVKIFLNRVGEAATLVYVEKQAFAKLCSRFLVQLFFVVVDYYG